MKIFLAGCYLRPWILDNFIEKMKIYLAGVCACGNIKNTDAVISEFNPYILESFFYADAHTERLLPYFGDFLLDSGAFTFMQGKGYELDWDKYVENYANFIKRNNVQKFFELDIDSVIGYPAVLKLREKLEALTNRQCIPVWHVSRGMSEFRSMCKKYSYVAIGGIVSKEIPPDKYGGLPPLIREAHKRGAKIHGLGFTSLQWLPRCHFDSVDSTAWTAGNRFGYLFYFDGKTMQKKPVPKGHRISDTRGAALHNFIEWVKFQQYAETHFKHVRKPRKKNQKRIEGYNEKN